MNPTWLLALLIGFIVLQRIFELRLARRNERWARQQGATEFGASHYFLFFLLHPAWLLSVVLEAWWRGPALAVGWPLWLMVFVGAGFLRYWAITALGRRWNTRILVIPNRDRVRSGPYRFLSHPNYVAVALELLSVPLIFGGIFTAGIFSLLNAVLLLRVRIPCEVGALSRSAADTPEEAGRPPATPEG